MTYPCRACDGNKTRMVQMGSGISVRGECPDCQGTGVTELSPPPPPFRGRGFSEEEIRALFTLVQIPVTRVWPISNRYWNDANALPWWLVRTPAGLVEIGWRKRVISINWSDTSVRKVLTTDDVTKDEHMVHAYSVTKATEYLTTLGELLSAAKER